MIGCNGMLRKAWKENQEKSYRVDIQRAVKEMKAGKNVEEIDLGQYKTILAISKFDPQQRCSNAYTVEEINGGLYRFEYQVKNSAKGIRMNAWISGIIFLGSICMLWMMGRKIIQPFHTMNHLVYELAKGNLSVPLKAEKNKFFGQFLWGLDMLREKLEQDKIRELELVKEKKTLLLSLSHDIKTPLSAIDLYAKALSQNLYDSEEKKQEAVLGIEKNAEEIKKYINEIADAAREEFLNLKVSNQEFYLSALVGSITKYYKEKTEQLHTVFLVDKIQDCLLYGDVNRAVEVMQNVMENAIKYGDGKEIHISFQEEENCKLITVENTACSLKEDEIMHVFDSFYRGSNSKKVKGSGLGLYICKEILHKMDGEIFARIIENRFLITIVLRKM